MSMRSVIMIGDYFLPLNGQGVEMHWDKLIKYMYY